ncbi:MAG: T9SS type A sorting domain-containing protein [Flavobacteriales bacterium]|nr:T9SS type A sorting domain-containing protein [Flavobacteriales bacterium]
MNKNLYIYKIYSLLGILISSLHAQTFVDSINHQSYTRYFRVHLPLGYNPSFYYPLVLNYHGYTSNALQQELYTGMSTLADEQNFIVVYPDGIANSWNVGFLPQPYFSGIDDVGFTNTLLDTLIARYSIDTSKVYACGMSNGGYMSYRLACELSHRITAIASVTGLMTDSTSYYCNPPRSVPVLQIHGTADPIVNYNGIPGSLSVNETLTFWANHNSCGNTTTTINISNNNTNDFSTVEQIDYTGCSSCGWIRFFKIQGGGHTWPDGAVDIPSYGPTNRDINATREIWSFFQMHSMPCYVSIKEEFTEQIKIFPNPASEIIQVHSEYPIERITLMDMSGKCLLQSSTNELHVANLQSGIYLLSIVTIHSNYTVRWIKSP